MAALAFLALTAVANSQPRAAYNGEVWVGFKGWGSVKLGKGMLAHRTVNCTRQSCPAVNYLSRGRRVTLTEKPYAGWKFSGWHGACKGKRPKCTINAARVRPNVYGERDMHVGATFVPVAQGITHDNPIRLGTTASVGQGWRMRVNSVMPNAQLLPAPPAGADYFAANVTIGYFGGASSTPENYLTWQSIGSHHTPYNPGSSPCPNQGPQPTLDTFDPLLSGQSRSGYVCWQIATNDATSLELYIGSGSLNYPGTTWFALR
jgi:Divergent InlB B-repeat domain